MAEHEIIIPTKSRVVRFSALTIKEHVFLMRFLERLCFNVFVHLSGTNGKKKKKKKDEEHVCFLCMSLSLCTMNWLLKTV